MASFRAMGSVIDGVHGRVSGAAGRPRLGQLASRQTALALGAAELVLLGLTAVLAVLAPSNPTGDGVAVLVIVFFAVGFLVAYNRPDHVIGWIFLGASGFLLLTAVGGTYSVLDYRVHHGHLALGPVAVLIGPSWAPAIALLALGLLLYPDGRLPSPRWRWPLRVLMGLAAVWQVGAYGIAINAIVSGRIRVTPSGDLYQIDHASGAWGWWSIAQGLFFGTMLAIFVAWMVGQVRGYRRLTGERRIQQKWLLSGAGIGIAAFTLMIPSAVSTAAVWSTLASVGPVGLIAIPLAIGVGILKYRLYDIDRLISRTLSYALLTALLVGTFVGLVALTTDLLPFSSTVGVAASTLAAAALFNPLRVRVQRLVDRRFNRARYDAEATVAAFAARLRDAVDLDAVQADLLEVVQRAVEPAHATIWLRPHRGSGTVATR
jgi:hypothetical protein